LETAVEDLYLGTGRDDLVTMLGKQMNALHTKTTSCQRRSTRSSMTTDNDKANALNLITVDR
jgi:hypothetical protein